MTSSLPVLDPNAPWHPDTLWDIRNINLSDLPHVGSIAPHEKDRHIPLGPLRDVLGILPYGGIYGRDGDIKEKMEEAFLRFPSISFMRYENGVVMCSA
jgi:hypothetical protein